MNRPGCCALALSVIATSVSHGQGATWPAACRALPRDPPALASPPLQPAALDAWESRLVQVIRAEEPDYVTPSLPPPPTVVAAVRELWKEDSVAVTWALARLATDGQWYGSLRASMYGRYYETVSGRAGPLFYYLRLNDWVDWRNGPYWIREPLTSDEEAFVFWQACMAVWPIVELENDPSWHSIVEAPSPPWLRLSADMLARTFRYLTPSHQELIAGAVRKASWDELGVHPPNAP